MANFITFPVIGTPAFGGNLALTVGTSAILDVTVISRVEPLSSTTTAIYFHSSPTTIIQKLVLTHTACPLAVNPLTGLNQFPVKDGIVAAITGNPTTPTVAVQIPAYVTGTAAAPVYTNVQIQSGVWS
jgi:hypothetical protein